MPSPTEIGFGGHGQRDDRHVEPGLADVHRDLEAVHLALQQGVDDQHVGLELTDLVDHRPAVGDDVEQLDLRLRVEKAANVVRDLRHVLDEEQAKCGIRTMGPDHGSTISVPRVEPAGLWPVDPVSGPLAATTMTRSLVGVERAHVVVTGDGLRRQAGGLDHRKQLVRDPESCTTSCRVVRRGGSPFEPRVEERS